MSETAISNDALWESEERYRLIVEGARDYAILTTDPDGRVESWSPGAELVFGWTAEELVGRPVDVTFTPEDRADGVPERERRVARERGVAPDVRWHLRKDGRRVFIDGTARALRDEAGRLRGFIKIGQDVTERRRLDDALRASEERYRAIVENVRDYAIFLLDARGVIDTWTSGAQRVKGYTADEVIGRHLAVFYTPEDVAAGEVESELAEAAETGRAEREGWRVHRDGRLIWVNEIATAFHDAEGRLAGFVKISRDLTERRTAAEVSERARVEAERDAVRGMLAAAEERERLRLARELHDVLGQSLTAIALELKALESRPLGSEDAERLARVRQLVAATSQQTHEIAQSLRPSGLTHLGLRHELDRYAREWAARAGVLVDVHAAEIEPPLAPEVEAALYRIMQEALTNVAKHARAARASVVLGASGGEVRLVVEDDGRGFDVDAALAGAPVAGRLGLLGMRERAALVGGVLELESGPGGGTTLLVRVPPGGRA